MIEGIVALAALVLIGIGGAGLFIEVIVGLGGDAHDMPTTDPPDPRRKP